MEKSFVPETNGQGLVSLSAVARHVGLTPPQQSGAVRGGLIKPVTRKGSVGGQYLITMDDALFLLAAAALAAIAGMAVVRMLRTLREAGATLGPSGMVIPVRVPR
jgi:hypothetical protein